MIVGIDAGGMTVRKRNLDGVVAHLRGGSRSRLGLEHRQRWRRRECGRSFRQQVFLAAFVVAGGARTVVAQIKEIEVGSVAVRPSDIYARIR